MAKFLLNAHGVKKLALKVRQETRPAWAAERVSEDFILAIQASVQPAIESAIKARIHGQPSTGKTLR